MSEEHAEAKRAKRTECKTCGLTSTTEIITTTGRCRNKTMCELRVHRAKRRAERDAQPLEKRA